MKKTLLILLIGIVAAGYYGATHDWFGLVKPKTASPTGDLTATAELRDIDFTLKISGDVLPSNQLDVKAEVGGKVKSYVEAGDTVKAGQLLVTIDERDIRSELESVITEIEGTKLTVEKMRRNHERAKELFEQKLISREAYDNLGSELDIAKNNFVRAERKKQLVEDKLSKTKVLAPSDGTVLTMPLVEGQVVIPAASVNSGTTLMTIANLSELLVESHVNQVDVSKLTPGQDVKLVAESIKDQEMDAQIYFIAPVASIKNNVKGFILKAIIEKPSSSLRPGMTVQMHIPLEQATKTVSVPVSAVFRTADNSRVVYVRNGTNIEKRTVKIGVSNLDHAQILQGLQEGEEILLSEPAQGTAKNS